MIDLSEAQWRKATASGGSNGNCVEVATNLPDVTAIRDSKRPSDGVHIVAPDVFAALLDDVKAGVYDIEH